MTWTRVRRIRLAEEGIPKHTPPPHPHPTPPFEKALEAPPPPPRPPATRKRRFRLAEEGIPKEAAYQMIHDELLLDCNPRLNLASFVTTWMEPECDQLILESLNKNYINIEEYPITNDLQVGPTAHRTGFEHRVQYGKRGRKDVPHRMKPRAGQKEKQYNHDRGRKGARMKLRKR